MTLEWSLVARLALVVFLGTVLTSCGGSKGADGPDLIPAGTYRLVVQHGELVNAATRGGTLFTLSTADGRLVAAAGYPSTWSTYCANTPGELHFFVRTLADADPSFVPLPKPDARLHSSHGFSKAGALHVDDNGTGRQYRLGLDTFGQPQPMQEVGLESRVGCAEFAVAGTVYRWAPGKIQACRGSDPDAACDDIGIVPESFPYAYAEHNGVVLVVTNWGEVLVRNQDGWCRALEVAGIFRCAVDGEAPMGPLTEPRGFQFYSSVKFQGRTLLGRWPLGLIYEFDGVRLKPIDDLPPSPASDALAVAQEAQSMAVYCGDLYVAYWPRGNIWSKSGLTGQWRTVGRAFTHPEEEDPAIPYLGREPVGADWAFLGQRVTSLSLLGDSLYAATSNLRGWSDGIADPDYLTRSQVAEYGTLHRIRASNCLTAEVDPSAASLLAFDISPGFIRVRRNGVTLAQVAYTGPVPQASDVPLVGDGVFGKMTNVSVVVLRSR
jgi:hypothetical protein